MFPMSLNQLLQCGLLNRLFPPALAKQAKTTVSESETLTIDGIRARAYRYGGRRIAFVVQGTDEYQLYCTQPGAACDLLFRTFAIG